MFNPIQELKKLVDSAQKHNWIMTSENWDTFKFWIHELEKSNKNE